VPVFGTSGRPAAALAISAPTARMSLAEAFRHLPKLRDAADRLSQTIVQTEPSAGLVRRKPREKAS